MVDKFIRKEFKKEGKWWCLDMSEISFVFVNFLDSFSSGSSGGSVSVDMLIFKILWSF